MDLSNLWGILPLVGIVIAVILVQSFFIKKNKPESQRTIVLNLLLDVKVNQVLVDMVKDGQKPKSFSSNNWQLSRNRLDFLSKSLQTYLSAAFDIVDDFNQQIRLTKKSKTQQYVNFDTTQLSEPLSKSRQGLENWLIANGGLEEGPPIRYPSMFDTLFGSGR